MDKIEIPVEIPGSAQTFLELLMDGNPIAIVALVIMLGLLIVAIKVTSAVLKFAMIGGVIIVLGVLFFPDLIVF